MTEFWEHPVQVLSDVSGGPRCVRNSRDALVSLSHDFPKECTEAGKARKVCIKATEGQVDSEVAAAVFRSAAKNAGLLRG
ncbi:DUF982 domain-containing protein [Rhizobiales bacterium RZME27]|jgi:hypothetical protein|uniref:DUF982 domain-containing protein n=1 Tax=Endobacterium cereale TaxID=2663029 RepID=A0A6A8AC25_9HYPH|nr:DUF982 domain-containing protein [Endobacterium cereale]MEB2847908.1 DUF982 domain-containing protein [Endobacterium cereale]MQY46756.1 DUF982 domain-containing protein [Endobacterium cereale]